jgi:Na+/H+-dicarboxylate symporter
VKQQTKLLLAFFVLGVAFGLVGHYMLPVKNFPFMQGVLDIANFVGALFLRTIFMVVLPLLTSALILGVFELGKERGLGKAVSSAIAFTVLLSSIAVVIAIGLTNVLQPGAGVEFDKATLTSNASVITIQKNAFSVADKPWYQYIVDLLPMNPVDSMARAFSGEILAVMFFLLIFGYALSQTTDEESPIIKVLDSIFQASMKVIDFAMKLAPFGIFGIVFNTAYRYGYGFLQNIFLYCCVVVLGLLIQQFIVYSAALKIFAKTSPIEFFKASKEVLVYAFSTSSSNVTLPVSLRVAEESLRLPPKISRFVLTIGATANQNGTALFEGVTVLFLAQVFGIDLTIGHQVTVVLMSILAGVGTAGVPGGSLPLIVILCTQVGIPAEGIGLILGVDRILDMCRTTLNVSGDLVVAKLVSASVTKSEQQKSTSA